MCELPYERLLASREKEPLNQESAGKLARLEPEHFLKNEAMTRYFVLNNSKQLFASKYVLYLPTEKELEEELKRGRRQIDETHLKK